MFYLIIKIYSKENIRFEDISKDYLLTILESKEYSFELYDALGNIIAAYENQDKENEKCVSDAFIVFEKPVIINEDIVSLLNTNNFEVIIPTVEQAEYSWHLTNGYFSIIENYDKKSFTFYREDGGELTSSEEEKQLMVCLLFEVLKLKYETEYSEDSFLFEPTYQAIGKTMVIINVQAKKMTKARIRQKN